MCVKLINDELEVAVRLSAEEESGCRQFAQRLDGDLASTLGNTAQHSSFLFLHLTCSSFLQAHSTRQGVDECEFKLLLQHNFMFFIVLRSSKSRFISS